MTANSVCDRKATDGGENEGKSWPQVLAIIIACLVPFTCGLLFSWPSPFIIKITTDKVNYDISEDEASYFSVIPAISMMLTSILLSNLPDKIGRKRTIHLIAIPQTIGWILTAVAKSIWMFYLARFIIGIGDGLMFSAVPSYIGEISTPKVRSWWGNALMFFLYIGQLCIQIIGSYCSVSLTAYICVCVPVIFFVMFWFIPESPYFYIMHQRAEEAKETIRWLKRKDDVEEDYLALKKDVERQMSESGTWKHLFTIGSNRKALFTGAFLRASQQLGGIGAFAVYIQYIFSKSGGNLSPELSSIIFFGMCCVLNLLGAYALNLLGRKVSYMVSLLFCGIMLLIEAVYFYIDEFETQIDISFLNWIPITAMMVYVLFYSIGLGIVPTMMLSELFSASIKAKGLTALIIVFGVLVCVTTRVFHIMTATYGLFSPFLLFCTNCFLSIIIAFYLIPETKGKTLEEIQQSLKASSNKKPKNGIDNNPST